MVKKQAVIAAFLVTPCVAWAHAGLVKSEPGRRAVVASAPERIKLCFNEKVEPKFSSVSLARADGTTVDVGSPAADAVDPRCLLAGIVGPMAPGSYTVKYKVLSVDGHIVDYGFVFSVKP